MLAAKLARAVYFMLKRGQIFDPHKFYQDGFAAAGVARRLTGATRDKPAKAADTIRVCLRARSSGYGSRPGSQLR